MKKNLDLNQVHNPLPVLGEQKYTRLSNTRLFSTIYFINNLIQSKYFEMLKPE